MKERVRHFALFGNPVGHSLSPLMINAAFGAMGIRAGYEARRVEDLEPAVRMIREKPLDGVSVTLPHKGAVMAFLDEAEDDARAIGAVNTVTNERGWLRGSNTDWKGLTAAMEERFPLGGRTIAVLAPAASPGGCHAICGQAGCRSCSTESRLGDSGEMVSCETQPLARLGAVGADVLINATPVGMHPRTGESPVDARLLPRFEWVVDTIYNPLQTRLLREARAAGCGVVTGLSMFVRQGAEQIRTWTKTDPPVELWSGERTALRRRIGSGPE